jgi:hypothetical protein
VLLQLRKAVSKVVICKSGGADPLAGELADVVSEPGFYISRFVKAALK